MTNHTIKGDKSTTFFDFEFDMQNNKLIISEGSYWLSGQNIFSYKGGVFELEDDIHYSVIIANNDILVLPSDQLDDTFLFLDKLAWGTIDDFNVKKIIKIGN